MISYVKGILAEKAKDRIVVESGMMGIGIFVPMSVLEVLPPLGEEVKIYTHLQVREDDMSLYGFLSRSDLEMFRQLLGVNGIGPKGALGILSALRPEDLRLAVMTGDAKAISRAPGVGAKTAQRIILDLKDKVQAEDLLTPLLDGSAAVSPAAGKRAFRQCSEGSRGGAGGAGIYECRGGEGGQERQCDGRDGFRGGIEGIAEISGVFVKQPMCRTFEIAGS